MLDANDVLEKMHPNQKINYDRALQKMIASWQSAGERPSILLHSCCAPCSTYCLEYLCQYADITVYFANSNIHPRAEYMRRAVVQQEFIESFNLRTGHSVTFLSAPYQPQTFIKKVKEQQLETAPEGGDRCTACFHMRLDCVAEKAEELGFDYFSSALTLSPKKNSQIINQTGLTIQKFYQTNYLPSDFKKNNGYQRSIEMCTDYHIYRQCYCGCIFAAQAQGIDLKAINLEAKEFLKGRETIVFSLNQKN